MSICARNPARYLLTLTVSKVLKLFFVLGAWYLFICSGRWIGVRLDLLSSLFITTIAFISLLTLPIIPLSPGQVGLTLTYAVLLLGMFQWGIRQSAEVENLVRTWIAIF